MILKYIHLFNTIIIMILPFVLFGIIFYFIVIKPQKKENQERNFMFNNMKIGDNIITTSGFYGILIDISKNNVIIEFGNNKNCRIKMKKIAIAQVKKI